MYLEPGYTGPKRVRPSELKYCHGTISNTFGDGTPLEKTFEDLVFGRMRPQDLPPVETMYYPFGGILCVTNGNRRLFILQKLEACGVISEITVMVREFDAELFKSKNLSLCNGSYVKVRDGNDLEEKLKNIWKTRSGLFAEYARYIEEFPTRMSDKKSSFPYLALITMFVGSMLLYYIWGSNICFESTPSPEPTGFFGW